MNGDAARILRTPLSTEAGTERRPQRPYDEAAVAAESDCPRSRIGQLSAEIQLPLILGRCGAPSLFSHLLLGHKTPWSSLVTGPSPLYTNFWTRCPR